MERATGGIPGIVCISDLSDATEAYKPPKTWSSQLPLKSGREGKLGRKKLKQSEKSRKVFVFD